MRLELPSLIYISLHEAVYIYLYQFKQTERELDLSYRTWIKNAESITYI